MHPDATDAIVALVQRRERQDDCPTEPAPSVEILEECILELARRAALSRSREASPPTTPESLFQNSRSLTADEEREYRAATAHHFQRDASGEIPDGFETESFVAGEIAAQRREGE